jgi:hypothetical protein
MIAQRKIGRLRKGGPSTYAGAVRFAILAGIASLSLGVFAVSSAYADLAATIQADLQNPASAVPGAQVTVRAPVGQESLVGVNPTSVAAVSMTISPGNPLSGVLGDPTAGLYTSEQPKTAIWELAVIEAVKHALAAGNTLDSVSITENVSGQPASPDPELIVSTQGWDIPARSPATMTVDQVKSNVVSALPAWAQNVTVVEDAASERVVTATATLPTTAFRVVDVRDILTQLLIQQHDLNQQGADIGRVALSVSDASTGAPLYAAAGDGNLGVQTSWVSPLVAGLVDDPPSTQKVPQEAADAAQDPAGTANGAASSLTAGN